MVGTANTVPSLILFSVQVVEGLTVHMEVFGITTVESTAAKNLHKVSFIFR